MKWILASLALVSASCFGAANDVAVEQRNATSNGWITRLMVSPPTDGLLLYNKTTLLPQWVTFGQGLSRVGNVLEVTTPQGPQGPVGPKGDAGEAGSQGPQGIQGAIGAQGSAGPTGAVGATGPTGPQGNVGPQGATGEVGHKGDKGDQGNTGAAGTPGSTGSIGPIGPQGDVGPAGAAGAIGPAGTISVGAPGPRTASLATAYQCLNTARSCIITVTLQALSAISITGASNNEGAITVGSTASVATGTGANIASYKNNLGGGLVVGLNLNSQQANTYTIVLPAGWYFAVRQTAGTGLQIVSVYDQQV